MKNLLKAWGGNIDEPHWYRNGRRRRLNRMRGYWRVSTFSFCQVSILQRGRVPYNSYTPRGHAILFTDIAIFMRATKTERKPQETEQDFLECPLHRSAAPPRLPSSSNFYIQALDPEVGYSKKTSSPRIYQRIHWKQRRYDHFFFSLSAFCLHTCTAGDSAETSASNSGQKMRYCPLISPLLNISAIYPPIYYTICIEIEVIIR